MKTTETTEEVSSDGMEKRVERHKSQRIAPFASEEPRADWKKDEKKKTCKPVKQEENHEKGPRRSWARNQMGNVSLNEFPTFALPTSPFFRFSRLKSKDRDFESI
jgi:hypothetical protein